MRYLVVVFALLMPIVAYLSNQQVFGPDNGTVSGRYPTLLAAAGYAFAIWGLIFALDIAHALWQLKSRNSADRRLPAAVAAGFALTAAWMPVFSKELFWLALVIIWSAWGLLMWAALHPSHAPLRSRADWWWGTLPLRLHAGWLSLAVFLNTAQVIVAYRWLDTNAMLAWSLPLIVIAAVLFVAINARLRGDLAFVAPIVWGLVALAVKQSGGAEQGAAVMAWMAAALGVALAVQTIVLRRRHGERGLPGRGGHIGDVG